MRERRVEAWALVGALYLLVAASSFAGFFAKWGFADSAGSRSFVSTLAGEAPRPFVYRQFIPQLTRLIVAALPEERKARLQETWLRWKTLSGIYSRASGAESGPTVLGYRIAYFLTFAFWLSGLALLSLVCFELTGHRLASLAAPLAFAQLYPILMTRGGYFYDPVELFFFAAAALAACRGKLWLLVLMTPFASLNKEAFLFWLICLWPLLPPSMPTTKRAAGLGAAVVASTITYLLVRRAYAVNDGSGVEYHLIENLAFYATPSSYFGTEWTYGLPLPRGVSVLNLAMLACLVRVSWSHLPTRWRQHLGLAALVNLPLLLMFCWLDELRNLSMLFVALSGMLALALARGIDALRQGTAA